MNHGESAKIEPKADASKGKSGSYSHAFARAGFLLKPLWKPLVIEEFSMENHHLQWVNHLSIGDFRISPQRLRICRRNICDIIVDGYSSMNTDDDFTDKWCDATSKGLSMAFINKAGDFMYSNIETKVGNWTFGNNEVYTYHLSYSCLEKKHFLT